MAEAKKTLVWIALIQYTDLLPFWFGNLEMPYGAPFEEVRLKMIELLDQHLPSGYTVQEIRHGQVIVQFDDE